MNIIEERSLNDDSYRWDWPKDISPLLKKIFSSRDIGSPDDINYFLSNILPVSQFNELNDAVSLLVKNKDTKIVIVGDFDVDGATSTTLMLSCLRDYGFKNVDYFIPDRFKLGYGLTKELVKKLITDNSPGLIVTVDNGITSIEGCKFAKENDIDVLITDHHLPGEKLPDAMIVNPNLKNCSFKGKNLAGVGVVFYLMAALGKYLKSHRSVLKYLDLVALGTVADLVTLDLTNRILIKNGLKQMRSFSSSYGIKALAKISNIKLVDIDESELSYKVAPKINAAGRLEDMSIGVKCLLSSSDSEAMNYARELEKINLRRRELDRKMSIEAKNMLNSISVIEKNNLPNIISLYSKDWHEGVVGIVASKIKEQYHRPVFIFASAANNYIKGSGRSIPGFHLRDSLAELDSCVPGLIDKFGGHAMAAGLTLNLSSLETFNKEIQLIASRKLDDEILARKILTDGQLNEIDFSIKSVKDIIDSGPWGQNFPEPLFEGYFKLVSQDVVGNSHLKMSLMTLSSNLKLDAIAFNTIASDHKLNSTIRVTYKLKINNYFDLPRLQLVINHIE